VQGAEFFDQQFAGGEFQLEIKRALHEDLDGFLLGHGILLPWECFFVSFAYLIGSFSLKLDLRNKRRESCGGKKTILALIAFLLVDTTGKMQHTKFWTVSGPAGS